MGDIQGKVYQSLIIKGLECKGKNCGRHSVDNRNISECEQGAERI